MKLRKNILFLSFAFSLLLSGASSAFAQNQSSKNIVKSINGSIDQTVSNIDVYQKTNLSSCAVDTQLYALAKLSTANLQSGVTMPYTGLQLERMAQYFPADTGILNGFSFYGYKTGPSPSMQLYYEVNYTNGVDSFPANTPILFDSLTLTNSNGQSGSGLTPIVITFSTPLAINEGYTISLFNTVTTDTLVLFSNNPGNGGGRYTSFIKIGPTWFNLSQDIDFMIFPFMEKIINTKFTTTADTFFAGETVNFMNDSSSFVFDPQNNSNAFFNDTIYVWNFGDGTDTVAWNASHAFSGQGGNKYTTYNVTLTERVGSWSYANDCSDSFSKSIVIVDSTVSIDSKLSEGNISIFPNPSNGFLNIKINNEQFNNANIEIYNVLGQEVHQSLANNVYEHKINLNAIKNGIYFVKITEGTKSLTKKLIIQH